MELRHRILWLLLCTYILQPSFPFAQAQQILGERVPLPDAVELRSSLPASPDAQPQIAQTAPGAWWNTDRFRLHAGLTESLLYDDNIYARSTNKLGDRVLITRPELAMEFKGPQYSGVAQVAVEDRRYSKFSVEDQTNVSASLGGTAMPREDIQVQSRIAATHSHEQRGASDSLFNQFDRPVIYNQYDAALAVNKRFEGWWTSLGGARTWLDYQNPTIQGIPIDQSYRNGAITVATGRVGVVVAPLTSAFIEVSGNQRKFDVSVFDSTGFRVVGGYLFEPGAGARIRGEMFAGYMQQDYVGLGFANIKTFTYGGSMALRLDQQTTAVLDGRREAKESILNGGNSVLESVVSARVDHQLTPQLTLGAGLGYLNQVFSLAKRMDESFGPVASLKYSITPNIAFAVDYRFIGFQSSNIGVADYTRNAVMVSVSGRL